MTCRGRVQNGVVVPEAGAILPEGAEVRIDIAPQPALPEKSNASGDEGSVPRRPSMYEQYQDILGVIKDLPPDASERVDDFLYGSPGS